MKWNHWESEEKEEEDIVVTDIERDEIVHAIWLLIQRKTTAQPKQPQLVEQLSFQETFMKHQ